MKGMKIAIVHYTAPPVVGGVEMVIQEHARIFLNAGHSVSIFAGRGDESALPAGTELTLVPEMDSQDTHIESINKQLEQGIVPGDFEKVLAGLFNTLSPEFIKYDHVIVHNIFTKHFNLPLTAALSRMLDKGFIKNCIAWCHDFTWTSPRSRSKVHPGYPWDQLRTCRSDMAYVVVSKQRQKELSGLFGIPAGRVQVIYNGVNYDQLYGLSPEGSALIGRLALSAADLVMLMPVRVTQAKNIEFALQTVAEIKINHVQPKLVITGPPDPHDAQSMAYFQSLMELRQSLSLEDQVRFVFESGPDKSEPYFIDPSIVADLFRVSDLMFMPSHREGFGMPVLEAGLLGIPVVCTNVPAAEEIGSPDVISFSHQDPPEKVARLIMDWMSSAITYRLRRRVRQEYTWESIYDQRIQPLLSLTTPKK